MHFVKLPIQLLVKEPKAVRSCEFTIGTYEFQEFDASGSSRQPVMRLTQSNNRWSSWKYTRATTGGSNRRWELQAHEKLAEPKRSMVNNIILCATAAAIV